MRRAPFFWIFPALSILAGPAAGDEPTPGASEAVQPDSRVEVVRGGTVSFASSSERGETTGKTARAEPDPAPAPPASAESTPPGSTIELFLEPGYGPYPPSVLWYVEGDPDETRYHRFGLKPGPRK